MQSAFIFSMIYLLFFPSISQCKRVCTFFFTSRMMCYVDEVYLRYSERSGVREWKGKQNQSRAEQRRERREVKGRESKQEERREDREK